MPNRHEISKKAANEQRRMILLMARYISIIFTPLYLPMMGLVALFLFTYLSMMPLAYKVFVLLTAYCFTILFPTTLIHLYRKYQGWSLLKLISREGRMVPYAISIVSYLACFYTMNAMHFPHFMSSIVIAAIMIQIICAVINNWWKISAHTAAIGGTTGAVLAFSLILGFYPLWWFCILLLLAGVVGTGRMLLRLHSLGEIVGGFLVGLFAAAVTVLMV